MSIGQQAVIKVCVVGESGVGKTSLLLQYCAQKFDSSIRPTVGCDFMLKTKLIDGTLVRIQLWDIAGQQRYNSVSKLYIRGAVCCIFVCSAVDKGSFQQASKWRQIVAQNCDLIKGSAIPCLFVMNKVDLLAGKERQDYQTEQFIERFSRENDFFDCEFVSAKLNLNVASLFQKVIAQVQKIGVLSKPKLPQSPPEQQLKLMRNRGHQIKKPCC